MLKKIIKMKQIFLSTDLVDTVNISQQVNHYEFTVFRNRKTAKCGNPHNSTLRLERSSIFKHERNNGCI